MLGKRQLTQMRLRTWMLVWETMMLKERSQNLKEKLHVFLLMNRRYRKMECKPIDHHTGLIAPMP